MLGAGGCGQDGLATHTNSAGSYCEEDLYNRYGQILPDQTRFGGTFHVTRNIGSKAQAYLALTFSENHIIAAGTPSSIRNSNPINTRGIVLPATLANGAVNPQDPFANLVDPATGQRESAQLYYRFGDIANYTDLKAKTFRAATGIDGTFGNDWGYSVAGTYSRTNLDTVRHGFLNVNGLTDAINNGTYNFINPSANTDAVRNSIAPVQSSYANSELAAGQVTITKKLFQLPGGPLQVGVGGQIRFESIYDSSADNPLVTLGINTFQAVGHRYVEAGFFEINAPIFDQLELDGSGRYDHYSSGFDHFSPKIGAKFTPIPQVALRGTYSQGFRAPSIPETSGAVIGFTNYAPGTGLSPAARSALQTQYGNDAYISQVYGLGLFSAGNPNLKPETSRAFTAGIVLQPRSWLSLTADYYNIYKKNLILQNAGGAGIADQYLTTGTVPPGFTITPGPADPANPGLRPTPFSVNALYFNGQSLVTDGIDAQIQATIPVMPGVKFTSALEGTEILRYNINTGDPSQGTYHYVGTLGSYNITSASGTPRWRANWQNTVEAGPYTLNVTTYFTSGYKGYADDNVPNSTCDNAIATSVLYNATLTGSTPGGALQCTVRHFIDVDLTGQVKVNKDFTFYVNVVNLLNVHAPFDPNTYGGTNYNPAWSTAGVIGRTFRAGANFRF